MKITLNKKFNFEGQSYKEIDIPIEEMSGIQLKSAVKKFNALNKSSNPILGGITMLAWNDDFIIFLAADFAKLPLEFFEALPAHDYMAVIGAMQGFLQQSTPDQAEK